MCSASASGPHEEASPAVDGAARWEALIAALQAQNAGPRAMAPTGFFHVAVER